MTTDLIAPHGGKLISRELAGNDREIALEKAKKLHGIVLDDREICDIEMIATGALSPLEGFMKQDDFEGVLDHKHLANGLAWTLPVTLSITSDEFKGIQGASEIALCEPGTKEILAILHIEEIYPHDRSKHALEAYGTQEEAHPGVAYVLSMGDYLVGGKIDVLKRPAHNDFLEHRRDPTQTRESFRKKGWKRVVAFQTRNPIHRAHEYLLKCALEMTDGLMVHPLVGTTKGDDVPATVRMKCYQALLEKYYPKDRVLLSVFPAAMRYAGPREAIFHAIVRKNYGCTHFIVGRDHAGVSRPGGGGYYGSFDAHYIFDEFDPDEIGITPLFFDFTFFCKICGGMASFKTCPHESSNHVALSGTKVREMLKKGEIPPSEFTRKEVAEILIQAMKS